MQGGEGLAQIRVEKSQGFTALANEVIQNPKLSLKAKGLLAYMLSVPADWDYSISGLSAKCREGKAAIRSAIGELMEAGHVTRSAVRKATGTMDGYEYVVYELPRPSCENRTTAEEEPPSCGFPTSDFPSSGNRTEQNKNLTKKNLTNALCSPPAGDGPAEDLHTPEPPEPPPEPKPRKRPPKDYRPEWFDAFWAIYPRKDGKQAAYKAWCKLRPDRATCAAMAAGLERARTSRQWTKDDGEFIPHASTWINGRMWEDQGVDLSLLPAATDSGGRRWAPDPEVIPDG